MLYTRMLVKHGLKCMKLSLSIALLLLIGCSDNNALGGEESTITLNWSQPEKMEDNTSLENNDIHAYHIQWGLRSDNLIYSIKVAPEINSYNVSRLEPGEYFFAVAVETVFGDRSQLSNTVTKVIE